jgi:predicted helicase
MSLQLIQQYYSTVDKLIQYGGSRNETAIRSAFQRLLDQYCSNRNLILIPELDYLTKYGTTVNPDGTLKDALRQDWGYWESKDQYDNLDDEIEYKINEKGYPTSNILFEDGQTTVLIQNGREVSRTEIKNPGSLHSLLTDFISYEPKEVHAFREAIEKFKQDLPDLLTELRQLIEEQAEINSAFAQARVNFLELCRQSINPHIVMADIREMLIQHILTEDIFITVFENAQFHQENNIALELSKVVKTFFAGAIRHNILIKIDPYIKVIKAAASNIYDHHEKQRFLKAVYENFYRAYSPAKADRLGIIYTPNEIVRFMVESADYLTLKHFGRALGDKDVDILDPAAGTGTFITELIEYLPKDLLQYKYENEIHCNEVAILPYYIANLNIEYTFAQKMGKYAEFKNICFVDTLDNLGFTYKNKQYHFLSISAQNLERIQLQNKRKISVIIGNPPYNANQLNENENNKNRTYPFIDKRIKETYIKHSTAQKTKLYDMYARFIRWAGERLAPNGVIAFVSNNSFIDARTYDGFRKVIEDEYSEIYVIDMKGNARTSGERRRREGGNVFTDEIRVGIAVYFLVRKQGAKGCRIYYNSVGDYLKTEAKKAYLRDNNFQGLSFTHIHPDKYHNWINLPEDGWDSLMPVATKETKSTKGKKGEEAIFKLVTLGVSTNRDEWVYDLDEKVLQAKIEFLISNYSANLNKYHSLTATPRPSIDDFVDYRIKWSAGLKDNLLSNRTIKYDPTRLAVSAYRPFVTKKYYFDPLLSDRLTRHHIDIFGPSGKTSNLVICFSGVSSNKPFQCLACDELPSLDLLEKTQCLPLHRYDKRGNRFDNITDWALEQFRQHYQDNSISKEAIFHYVYSLLHHPVYREKYAMSLKRQFPRIPFYDDFWKWEGWGKQLMDLHVNYEAVDVYPLGRVDKDSKPGKPPVKLKAKLRADKDANIIELDSITALRGIPKVAWEYKLGNRSAIGWVLEYYRERNPRDPTIRQKFNTYHFADYKEQVIDLLARVCTISVHTMKIIGQMGPTS